jgi:hypothetical protein
MEPETWMQSANPTNRAHDRLSKKHLIVVRALRLFLSEHALAAHPELATSLISKAHFS